MAEQNLNMEEYKLRKCMLSSAYGIMGSLTIDELASDIAHYIYHLRVNKDTMGFNELYNGIEAVDKLVIRFQTLRDGYYMPNKDVFRWFSHVKPEIEKAILNSRVVLC